MDKEEIKEYLADFQKKELPHLTPRQIKVSDSKKIKSIIGPRRAGKTFLMYQKIKELLREGVQKESIIYLNLEDTRLLGLNFKEIREIIKLHWQLFPSSVEGQLHIFIDEPQNVKGWEHAVRGLHDEGFDIYLTGSSSKLLSKEIATLLRGRAITYLLLPFSFKEFLHIKGFDEDIKRISSKGKAVLLSFLDEYLEFGGFPEIILEKDEGNRLRIINDYFSLVIYKDIVERYGITNTKLVKKLLKGLALSFSKEFSLHKAFQAFKSEGIKVSKNTLYSYLSIVEDSFFVFFVPKFDYSARKERMSLRKAYLCDTSFVKLIEITKEKGKKIENAVFLELERRKTPLSNIYFWKNMQQEEVDFVVKDGPKAKQLIQACSNISNQETRQRELKALLKASKELKCNNLLLISEDKEGVEKVSLAGITRKVKFMPLWKWLITGK